MQAAWTLRVTLQPKSRWHKSQNQVMLLLAPLIASAANLQTLHPLSAQVTATNGAGLTTTAQTMAITVAKAG